MEDITKKLQKMMKTKKKDTLVYKQSTTMSGNSFVN